MTDQAALMHAFADYARTISSRYEIGDVLYRLTDQAMEVLGISGAGVSIADKGALQFVTATDDRVVRVEERQIEVGQGPCHDAFASREHVTTADLHAEKRWPRYTPVALEQGCRAVAGIPMVADDQCIGAINLYDRDPREWPADVLDIAGILADMASGYILNARNLTAHRVASQLQHALDTRVVVEQAKGILAERHGMDLAAAFDRIRKHARDGNKRVPAAARAIVEGPVH